MSMKLLGSAVLLILLCSLQTTATFSEDSGKQDTATSDEYAVYAAGMKRVVGGDSFVLVDTTTLHDKPENLDSALSFPIEDADRISADLSRDFKAKNLKPHTIVQRFPEGIHVALLSERERSAIFAGCMGEAKWGWKTFYEKYQSASGIPSNGRRIPSTTLAVD